MRNECNIIRDILPLYLENMVSDDTTEFVKEHLENCNECRNEYEGMKEPKVIQPNVDTAPLVKLKRKIWGKRIQTVIFTAILAIAIVVSAFAVLSAPVYFPYSDNLCSVTENADQSITITFDEKVTGYSCDVYLTPDSENEAADREQYYSVEAWTSLWDEWFSDRGIQSVTIQADENLPFTVYYVSNNHEEDVCIYGRPLTENGGVITLPRLALGYYLILAVLCFGVLFIVWFIVRRKLKIKEWIERIMLYPVSYIIGHFIVSGVDSTSYSMQRDFLLIIFISILLYCGLLLARSIYGLRKEISF